MMSPKALEAWFTLMNEAMRGTQDAQQALKSLAENSGNSNDLSRWLETFMPNIHPAAPPETFETWLEEWWRVMGVVPRARYLELLERCDALQRRLERAEETIQNLKELLGSQGQDEEARQALDLWSSMLAETLKTQTEWMQAWTAANQQPGAAGEDRPDPATGKSAETGGETAASKAGLEDK
ncbi:MAG TPA: hypothetical protein VGD99_26235 [Anaerolineae bacterium]|jgi:hypothetical protein